MQNDMGRVGRPALLGELELNDTKCYKGSKTRLWETVTTAAQLRVGMGSMQHRCR